MPYELRTFGGLDLRDPDGRPVEAVPAHSKGVALLAYLAAEAPDGQIPRSRVAALLWPGREDARAQNALRVTLTRLRQATDPPLIAGKGEPALRLARDRVWADVTAFTGALEDGYASRALELYRGDFLAGLQMDDARPFRRWADQRRERFRDRAYDAAFAVAREARDAGDLEAAETALRRALDLRPLREDAAASLVRTLAERGRPADAVQVYEGFRERRREELNLPVSDRLQGLVHDIRTGAIDGPAPEGAGTGADGARAAAPSREETGGAARANEPASGNRSTDAEPISHGTGEDARPTSRPGGRSPRRRRFHAAAVLVLLSATVAAWYLTASEGTTEATLGSRSVAVLPFEAIGTEDPGPVAEGMHSDLLTRLANVSGLKVISATSVERYRDTDLPLPAIADSLGVRWVVEGDVQRAGDAIRVNAQLLDPRTDAHVWAESYRRELTAENVFTLQREMVRRVARALDAEISAEEEQRIEQYSTTDLRAYRLYLRGRRRLNRRIPDEMAEAMIYFQRALAADSAFAPAWAGVADVVTLKRSGYSYELPPPVPDPEVAAGRALDLVPDLPEAHASMGYVHLRRHDGLAALRELERAVELKPSYAQAHHWLGVLYLKLGRPEAAREHLGLAVELAPRSWLFRSWLGTAYAANGDIERALAEEREVTRLHPSTPPPWNRVRAFAETGRYEDVRRTARDYLEKRDGNSSSRFRAYLGMASAHVGDTAEARAHLARLDEKEGDLQAVGFIQAALGETDRAFAAFDRGDPASWSMAFRYFFPRTLGPLRRDPRYDGLMRELNRAWGLNPDGSLPGSVDISFGSPSDE